MAESLVEFIGAGRNFPRGAASFPALAFATCRVFPGDRIAVVGPSGSGKSTLLHLMAGLDRPSSGWIVWPGLGSVEGLRPGKIALVFQVPSLLPSLNVLENVELPLLLGSAASGAAPRAKAALDLLGLGAIAGKLPEELSGGQAQRAAMARAIAGDPMLLLADEPTGQLDHTTAGRLLDALLAHFAGSSTAIVIATHDASVAARMDKIWRMHHGILDAVALDEPVP